MLNRVLPYLVLAVLAGGAGAAVAWRAHPDGVEQRRFHGVITNVNQGQTAVGVRTTDYGAVAGLLANDGPPLRVGQTVDGLLYGEDAQVVEVFAGKR